MKPLGVKSLDHVTLVVKDAEKTTRFFRDLLGMEEVARPAFDFPGRWYQIGKTLIHVNVEDPNSGTAGMPDMGASIPSRGLHIAFEVEDCDAAADQIRAEGIEIVVGPKDRPDGARQLYLYDPDRHLIEIFSQRKR